MYGRKDGGGADAFSVTVDFGLGTCALGVSVNGCAFGVRVNGCALEGIFTCDSAFAFCAEAAFENSAAFGGCEDDDVLDEAAAFSANCFFLASRASRNSSKSFPGIQGCSSYLQ